MIRSAVIALLIITGSHTRCYAISCNCDDWMGKGGYCVDYVKSRIPNFPVPNKDDMVSLKNADVDDVTAGDVAIFAIKNYWHVAYVENVHRDFRGMATAIDVTEMNFGGELSFPEFKAKWKGNSEAEYYRAMCCGVTDNYDQVTSRKYVPLHTVKQIWSPDDVDSEGAGRRRVKAIVDNVREVFNRIFDFAERDL